MGSEQRLTWTRAFFSWIFVMSMTLATAASELNDSMQLFFSGDYAGAKQRLTRAIERGEMDARHYYFRGLTNYRMGAMSAAQEDFKKGAQLEISGAAGDVGLALQRVQGVERLQLEKYRRLAKLRARSPMATYRATSHQPTSGQADQWPAAECCRRDAPGVRGTVEGGAAAESFYRRFW